MSRPLLLDRLAPEGHVVIEAAAGTGKTYTLESLVADLLAAGHHTVDQILVVTFTEKATAELRGRLRDRLERLTHTTDPQWPTTEAERVRLERALADFEAMGIHTIHGWCRKVLDENAFHQRRLFDEALVDGVQRLRRVLRHELRRLLIEAGSAGDELRRGLGTDFDFRGLEQLTLEIAQSRADLGPPWSPATLVAAAEQLRDLLRRTLPSLLAAVDRQHHANTARAAKRRFEGLSGLCRALAEGRLDPFEAAPKIVDWYGKAPGGQPLASFLTSLSLNSELERRDRTLLLEAISDLEMASCDRLAYVARELAARTHRQLAAERGIVGEYDYDDLLLMLRDALQSDHGAALAASLGERYRVALIDEFQDTDEVQWEIFRQIFFANESCRLFLVGDPKQAIYGFRNADVATYQAAVQQVLAGGGQREHLAANYRSTPDLIEVQNALFADFFEGGIEFRSAEVGQPGLATFSSDGEALAPVVLLPVAKRSDFAERYLEAISAEIDRLVAGNVLLRTRAGDRTVGFGDIQILTRSRAEAEAMGSVLQRFGLPFALHGLPGLFESEEAADLRALFAAIAEPNHRSRRARAWLTPFFELRLRDLPEWQRATDDPAVDCQPSRQLHRWHGLARAGDLTLLFERIREESGVLERAEFLGNQSRRIANYEHLFEELLAEGDRLGTDVRELSDRLTRLTAERRDSETESNTQRIDRFGEVVQVLTVHKAKGLESPIVFLCGGWSKVTDSLRVYHEGPTRRAHIGKPGPCLRPTLEREARSENQRLAYVAVTRASHRLYLPYGGQNGLEPARGSFYRGLHERIAQAITQPDLGGRFEIRPQLPRPAAPAKAAPRGALEVAAVRAAALEPPPALSLDELLGFVERHAAVKITSYSQASATASSRWEPTDLAPEGPDELPGGRRNGVFLHEVLEHIDYGTALAASDAEGLFEDSEASRLFSRLAERHGVAPRHWSAARELLFAALRTPIETDRGVWPDGLAAVSPAREIEFLFPFPVGAAPPVPPGPGYFQGVIDVVFEHAGLYFVLDWKSDRRSSWSADDLARHVEEHYALQARLYTHAVVRQLGIADEESFERRFGGVLYCFLRGLAIDAPGRGVHWSRPSWSEIASWLGPGTSPPGATAGGTSQ